MENILIVAETRHFMIRSIESRLKGAHYNVISVPADTDAIHEVRELLKDILIWADESVVNELQALNFLKDRAVAEEIPIILLGDQQYIKGVKHIIPGNLVHMEFPRPINLTGVLQSLEQFNKKFSSQIKKNILVVDDSGATLRNVKGWLEGKYSVTLANSGAMAIKYLTLKKPDLVILDYEMPIVNGKQVLEQLRAEADFADIPVMFLTNKSDKESIMTVQDLKPENYLLKTLEPWQIVEIVDNFFEKRKAMMF